MARFPITETECNQIIAMPKTITSDISWTSKPNKSWSACRLDVQTNARLNLEIRITVNNDDPSKFSIVLLLNALYRIKGLCFRGSHENKCTDKLRWNSQLHKHIWSDSCPGGHAYTPSDITGSTLQEVFNQFCNECNITFSGYFKPLPIQTSFTGV
jgi:hypothetical protein